MNASFGTNLFSDFLPKNLLIKLHKTEHVPLVINCSFPLFLIILDFSTIGILNLLNQFLTKFIICFSLFVIVTKPCLEFPSARYNPIKIPFSLFNSKFAGKPISCFLAIFG